MATNEVIKNRFTAKDVTYDGNNDQTIVETEENIRHPGSGTLIREVDSTVTATAMHFSGGFMFYGDIHWPARLPDVALQSDGNYDIRLQNEYVSSGIRTRGPFLELTGVDQVVAAWHLETAMHVYVKDTAVYDIQDSSTTGDWFEIDEDDPNAFISGQTVTVSERGNGTNTYTVDSANFSNSTRRTRIEVQEEVPAGSGGAIEANVWYHWRRMTPNEQGVYTGDETLYSFESGEYEASSSTEIEEIVPGTGFIEEKEVVVYSRVNRPLEVISEGFEVAEESRVRAIFASRLSEKESLQSYSFYIATGKRIYVAKPIPDDKSVEKRVVSGNYGIGLSYYNYAVYSTIPGGAAIKDTEGSLRFLSGRQTEQFMNPGEPWNTIYDIEYRPPTNELAIASDTGVWFYDTRRKGIFRQHEEINVTALAYSKENNVLLGWDEDNSVWVKFDGGGNQLNPYVTTQSIDAGGTELNIDWIKIEYDKSGYSNTDKSTFAELWQTVRSSEVMDFSENENMIEGDPATSVDHSSGDSSISVTTDSDDNINLASGDKIRFSNHSDFYEVASDVTISSSSSGTISLSGTLNSDVPQGTQVRPKYRGIFKLPRRERVRPPFRGTSHKIQIRNFDTLRDIQIKFDPRINYE